MKIISIPDSILDRRCSDDLTTAQRFLYTLLAVEADDHGSDVLRVELPDGITAWCERVGVSRHSANFQMRQMSELGWLKVVSTPKLSRWGEKGPYVVDLYDPTKGGR